MERLFILQMVMLRMNKKGYGMLSLLVLIVVMTSISLITFFNYHEVNLDKYYFINNYLYEQSNSIASKEDIDLNNKEGRPIHFNKDGKVNMAQTIDFNNGRVVIHVGSGYLTYE